MRLVTMSGAGALIDHRGGPRYGPPDPSSERGYAPLGLPRPSLGRAPAQPWRASDLTQDVSSRRQRQPAVHHERLAGDPARLVAGEIDGGPADVPRRTLDAERDRPTPALAHLGTEVLDHRSPHRPGRDRVDANRFRRELVRHADDEAGAAGVGGEGERLALLRADEPDRLLRAILLRVHAEHARALARHEDRGGLAVAHARTARARARHDRDLAGESFAHWGRVLLGPYNALGTPRPARLRSRALRVRDHASGEPRARSRLARGDGGRTRIFPRGLAQPARLAAALQRVGDA